MRKLRLARDRQSARTLPALMNLSSVLCQLRELRGIACNNRVRRKGKKPTLFCASSYNELRLRAIDILPTDAPRFPPPIQFVTDKCRPVVRETHREFELYCIAILGLLAKAHIN